MEMKNQKLRTRTPISRELETSLVMESFWGVQPLHQLLLHGRNERLDTCKMGSNLQKLLQLGYPSLEPSLPLFLSIVTNNVRMKISVHSEYNMYLAD